MKTPQNQKRLTNVAIVNFRKGGERFELACYPNTVEAWRDNIETDLDEVLQSHQIFVNVSKGQLAKSDVVAKAFKGLKEEEILHEILRRGELQVGEKERELALSKMRKEIASSLAGMSVNPVTLRPYPVTMIEKAMKDVHFKPDPKKSAKRQAKELLEVLKGKMPIERAKMRLKISCHLKSEETLSEGLKWEEESRSEQEGQVEKIVLIEPVLYRQVEERAKKVGGKVLVMNVAVTAVKGTEEEDNLVERAEKMTLKTEQEAEAKEKNAKKEKSAAKANNNNRAMKSKNRDELMGVIDDDSDDDWKNEKKGKGGKKKKKKK